MTGTNSSNDRLMLSQNMEKIPGNTFHMSYFFGNEIVDHVEWKCAITKKNVSECSIISTIFCGLSNDHRSNSSFIHHLLRSMMSFSFFFKNFPSWRKRCFLVRCQLPGCKHPLTLQFWDNTGLSCRLNHLNIRSRCDEIWCPYAR